MFAAISPATRTAASRRKEFIANLLAITGDTRLLWLPDPSETTGSTDRSLNARALTYDATIAAQISALGYGTQVSFDGSTDEADTPDVANLSFVSTAFSVIAVANVTNTAVIRSILSKWNTAGVLREYRFTVDAADLLALELYDESLDKTPFRKSDAAITMGSWRLFGATYDGGEGATAANGITLYQDGTAIASTATNDALYVAMEDLATVVGLGQDAGAANLFNGSLALVAVVAKQMTASEVWAVKELCNSFFGLSL